jgi:pimeloyl-ACP methyl ester carboxylesterase
MLLVGLVAFRLSRRGGFKKSLKGLMGPGPPTPNTGVERVVEGAAAAGPQLPEPERVAPGIERKMIDVGELEFWYLEGGAQHPVSVLLLHGFAGDKEQWLGLMSLLVAKGLRVVAPDLPGCGQNDKDPDETYDIMTQAKRVRAFAHRLAMRSMHLVGASMGATIAAALARASPTEARSLVMIEPFGLRVPRETELDQMLANDRNPLIIAAPAAYDNLVGFLCATPAPDRFKRERAERLAADRAVNLKIWQDIGEGDRAHLLDLLLPELAVRTLTIHGEKSKVVHPASAEVIHHMMPNAQSVIIPDCGHWPMVEKLPETAQHLVPFLVAGAQPAS